MIPCWDKITLCLLLVLQGTTVARASTVQRRSSSSSDKTSEQEQEESVVGEDYGDFDYRYAPPVRHPLPTRPATSWQMSLMTTTPSSRQSLAQRAVYAPIRRGSSRGYNKTDGKTRNDDNNRNGHRMQSYSLAQQMDFLSQKEGMKEGSNFEFLLRTQQVMATAGSSRTNTSKSDTPVVSPVFWSILGSTIALAFSSWLWDPSHAQNLWNTVVSKKLGAALAVAWLPWVWANPTQLALADLLFLIQLARQPAVLPYLQTKVLPIVWKTVKAMIVAEVWSRGWKWFFLHLEALRQSVVEVTTTKNEKYQTNDSEASEVGTNGTESKENLISVGRLSWPTNYEPPNWFVEAHSVVIGGIQKGIKSSVKKSIQETITASCTIWINAIEEQLMVAP